MNADVGSLIGSIKFKLSLKTHLFSVSFSHIWLL